MHPHYCNLCPRVRVQACLQSGARPAPGPSATLQEASRDLRDTKSCRHAGWGTHSPCSPLRSPQQTIAQHQQSRQHATWLHRTLVQCCVCHDDAVLVRHCGAVLIGHECELLLLYRVTTPTATGLILCPPASTHSTGQHSSLQQQLLAAVLVDAAFGHALRSLCWAGHQQQGAQAHPS